MCTISDGFFPQGNGLWGWAHLEVTNAELKCSEHSEAYVGAQCVD